MSTQEETRRKRGASLASLGRALRACISASSSGLMIAIVCERSAVLGTGIRIGPAEALRNAVMIAAAPGVPGKPRMTPFYIAVGWIFSGALSLAILIEAKKTFPPKGWLVAWALVVIALGPFHLTYLMWRLGAAIVRRLRRLS